MTIGNDPLDDWGPQAPVHRGREARVSSSSSGHGDSGGHGAGNVHGGGSGGGSGADRAPSDPAQVPTDPAAIAEKIAGHRRVRSFLVGAMVLGDIAVIAIALFFLEPPARWFVVALGVLGFAAAAYMWTIVSKPIKPLEDELARRTGNPHYPGA